MARHVRQVGRERVAGYNAGHSLLAAAREGLDERLITDNEKHRIYMRAVRDGDGNVIGYYERYEPPVK